MQHFSVEQTQKLQMAVLLLPERQRDAFCRSVTNRLAEYLTYNDADVDSQIVLVLGCYGVSAPRFFAEQRRRA
jgi:hypothetical protein